MQPGVARGGESLVGLADEPHPGIPFDDRRRVIVGPVVDDDHLVDGPRLSSHAFDCLIEEARVVVRRDDNRDSHSASDLACCAMSEVLVDRIGRHVGDGSTG